MDIREVRSFLALAGQSHFGRTARLLNLSQPALTKQIRRLEEDLGVRCGASAKNARDCYRKNSLWETIRTRKF